MAREELAESAHLRQGGYARGTAGRAYLAMEAAATAMILSEGERHKEHGEIIGAYGRLFAKTHRVDPKFHRYLIDAFKFRAVVDYDPAPEPPLTIQRAEEVFNHATEFVNMAEEFLKGAGGESE